MGWVISKSNEVKWKVRKPSDFGQDFNWQTTNLPTSQWYKQWLLQRYQKLECFVHSAVGKFIARVANNETVWIRHVNLRKLRQNIWKSGGILCYWQHSHREILYALIYWKHKQSWKYSDLWAPWLLLPLPCHNHSRWHGDQCQLTVDSYGIGAINNSENHTNIRHSSLLRNSE